MGDIIDGKAVAARVREEVRERVARLRAAGVVPGLDVVLVGDHEPSRIYVRLKHRACEQVGIASHIHHLPASVSQAEMLALIGSLNADPRVHGILVQLPLPLHLTTREILSQLSPAKDVDGFHPDNMGRLATGRPSLAPCTPKGVMRLLREYDVDIQGAHAVVVGRSRVVGRPMGMLLLAAHATVTTCHRHTVDTWRHTSRGDIVVVAAGVPGLVRGDWVKPDAVVVDVGTTRLPDGRISGDVAFDEVAPRARLISPVPGGVGPMTIAMLLENTCVLAESASGLAPDFRRWTPREPVL